jgi:thioredoxin reductase (NADPH)
MPDEAASQEQTGTADRPFDAVVVGGGPSGLTAALYLSRARRSVVVVERNMAGGQMALTDLIENYPGFPDGVGGFELSDRLKAQATKFGAEVREITGVSALQAQDGRHTLATDQGTIHARAVLLAPGRQPRSLGVPGEAELFGRGVSSCGTCDGPLYRGRTLAVVGGGDTAVEEGMFLTKFAAAVHVLHRREELRCTPIAQERAFGNAQMSFVWNARVRRILGDTKVQSIEYEDICSGEVTTLPVDGVFIFVGQVPNTAFLQGAVTLDDEGYIVTNEQLRTSREGVFASGDARANPLKQIAFAVGEGALAAVQMDRYLDTL